MASAFRNALGAFVVALIIVVGVAYVPYHHFYFRSAAYVEFFERLPATLELIGTSGVIALVLAAICTLLSRGRARWIGVALAGLLFAAMCIPAFWVALMAQLELAIHGLRLGPLFLQLPTAGMSQSDKPALSDELVHLILPAMLLALFQAGSYVDTMRAGTSARRLFSTFAVLLPAILGADVIIETIFAWPGDGRMFYNAVGQGIISTMLACLLVGAAAIVIVRSLAESLNRDNAAQRAEVLEPL